MGWNGVVLGVVVEDQGLHFFFGCVEMGLFEALGVLIAHHFSANNVDLRILIYENTKLNKMLRGVLKVVILGTDMVRKTAEGGGEAGVET